MLRGLTTVSFYAGDVAAAADWYAGFLGVRPYFRRPVEGPPVYVEFRIGEHEHELGIVDARFAPHAGAGDAAGAGGAVVYWHVEDVPAAVDRALGLGASLYEGVTERGPGFVTACVRDPFGNLLGVMFNEHYVQMSAR
ncbi:VOC family protein [Actinomadura parmotrematis]|uniref:VOC family protein n=1 Tax=Actinomadura parmotrematis TaxID=2864039 RepID=A0ABS7G4Q9_9ACTN|nr:VOC family protein [Actinomadura parmotrematis]MBW8487709.1 VOC family protein [Actinomadura parmotrematis]